MQDNVIYQVLIHFNLPPNVWRKKLYLEKLESNLGPLAPQTTMQTKGNESAY